MAEETVSLKEHLETRIDALDNLINKTFELNNIAIKKAEDSVNLRLEGMNEFRAQLKDQQATFLPATEFKVYQTSVDTQFQLLKERMNDLDTVQKIVATKASMPMVWIVGAGTIVGLILSIISLIQKWVGN